APVAEIATSRLDLQLSINVRSMILYYRECHDMLTAAGAEHGNALAINLSSIAGKRGQGWLSVYSATKHAVVGFTQAMNKELGNRGVKSVALCPAFVNTPMTDFIKEAISPEDMIQPQDIVEATRPLLRLSRACRIPEIVFER